MVEGANAGGEANLTWKEPYWFLLASATLFAVYLPAFIVRYGMHNDYNMSYHTSGFAWHGETSTLLILGRPINALLCSIHHSLLHGLDDLLWSRVVGFVLSVTIAWILFRFLTRRVLLPAWVAACTIVIVFTTPAWQLNITWAEQMVPNIVNVVLALFAYSVYSMGRQRLPESPRAGWCFIVAGMALFVTSLMVYPATATFFLFPAFCRLLFEVDRHAMRRCAAQDLVFCVVGMGAYFAIVKFAFLPLVAVWSTDLHNSLLNVEKPKEFAISLDWRQKLSQWHALTELALSPWGPGPDGCRLLNRMFLAVGVLLSTLTLGSNWRADGPRTLIVLGRHVIELLLLGTIIVAVVLAPILAPKGWNVGYRMLFPYAALVAVFLVWVLVFRRPESAIAPCRFRTLSLILMTCTFAVVGKVNVLHAVTNAHLELSYVRQSLAGFIQDRNQWLVFVRPRLSGVLLDQPLCGEFRQMALNYGFMGGIVDAALAEMGCSNIRIPKRMLIDQGQLPVELRGRADVSIVDLNAAHLWRDGRFARMGKTVLPSTAQARSDRPQHGPLQLFDWDLTSGSFWEVSGEHPITLALSFDQPLNLGSYFLQAGVHHADRMPIAWTLEGLQPSGNWVVLDTQAHQGSWTPKERRAYVLGASGSYQQLRMIFPGIPGNRIMRIYGAGFEAK